MNQKSLRFGVGITLLWLLIVALFAILGDLTFPSSLNELGDFLAGIFAPIAFFWLILGYIQQAKQLEQNTQALQQQEHALQLQIEEMRESVKQQAELANLQQQQMLNIHESVRPKVKVLKAIVEVRKTGEYEFYKIRMQLKNIGHGVMKNILFYHDTQEHSLTALNGGEDFFQDIFLKENEEKEANFSIRKLNEEQFEDIDGRVILKLRIEFQDIYGFIYAEEILGLFDFNEIKQNKMEIYV